jgi:hypothetical protein
MGMGSPEEGLQAIDGITQDYFTKYGEAQAFVQEMNAVGIDVTKPNLRNQEERDAANLYRKMMADIRYKGEELKNSQKMLEKFASAKLSSFGADIGYKGDPNKPFDIYQAEHTGMTSQERDAAIGGRQQQQIDATASNTDKRINAQALQGDLNREVQLRIANIRLQKDKDKVTAQIAPFETIYEDAVNLVTGNTNWKQSKRVSQSGRQMLSSPFWAGKRYGSYEDVNPKSGSVTTKPRIIKGGLLDPTTGDVFIEFEHGAMEKVDSQSLQNMVGTYAESNRGYKSADAQVFNSMLDEVEYEAPVLDEGAAGRSEAVYEQSQVDMKKLDELWRGAMGGTAEFKLDDGTVIKMDKEWRSGAFAGTGIKIRDAEALGIPESSNEKDPRIYTKEEAIGYLHQLGYYSGKKFQGAAQTQQTQQTPITTQAADTTAAPAAAPTQIGTISQEYKTPEYQARLKKQNETLKDFEKMDEIIIQIAEMHSDSVDVVAAAMNVYLELDAEMLFNDWYNSGGREVGVQEVQEMQVGNIQATQGDPSKL